MRLTPLRRAEGKEKYVYPPEPFVRDGRSYVVTLAASRLGQQGRFPTQPIGPVETWIAGIDPAPPFYRGVHDPTRVTSKLDPEVYVTVQGAMVYYRETLTQNSQYLLRGAQTGLE